MFRGLVRAALVPQKALAYRTAICPFSTRSILRQPRENDDRIKQPDLTNDNSKSSPDGDDADSSSSTLELPGLNLKSSASSSSSIPFSKKFESSSSNSSKKDVLLGDDDWKSLMDTMNFSQSSENNFNGERRIQLNTSLEETLPLDPSTRFEDAWTKRHLGGRVGSPAKPSDGRVIEIRQRVDVDRAYVKLMSLLARNGVKKELRLQEYFEKPNQKRRRLKSERHRRRFAAAVREKVQMVMELQARGI